MTDRMYLIGQALAGLCAHPTIKASIIVPEAVRLADAALAAAGEKEDYEGDKTNWKEVAESRMESIFDMRAEARELKAEIARLRAELARYTEPLTGEQLGLVCGVRGAPVDEINNEFYARMDAAIRKVRAGKGE
jgi:hypothetical protein